MMPRQIWKRITLGAGVGFVYMALLVTTAPYLSGQEHSVEAGKAPASAQPVERDYRFEVAAIRPTDPYSINKAGTLHPYSPGRYRQERIYLGALVDDAFGIKQNYQIKYPQWMHTAYFAVDATLPEGATKADLPIMIRHLLEDRFALKYHHETRRMAGYELVVAKSGAKLAKSVGPAPDNPANISPSAATPFGPGIEFKNGAPVFGKDARSTKVCGGPSVSCWLHGHDKTMTALASDLATEFDGPVMDATGLDGGYDYTLTFTPESKLAQGIVLSPLPPLASPGPTAGGDGASAPQEHPLLRDALREQLGLELKPVKNVPVDVVVIDSANKVPTEN
jgi:uncharacterized protein (TIGR03435 family)